MISNTVTPSDATIIVGANPHGELLDVCDSLITSTNPWANLRY